MAAVQVPAVLASISIIWQVAEKESPLEIQQPLLSKENIEKGAKKGRVLRKRSDFVYCC